MDSNSFSGKQYKQRTLEPKVIKELRVQLHAMHIAARPFLTDEARRVYWDQAWESAIVHATTLRESSRKQFNSLRLTSVISVTTVPLLTALNLSGIGSTTVKWLIFALSLIAALSTATAALFPFNKRWLSSQTFITALMTAGWRLVNSPGTEDWEAWARFTAATDAATSNFNAAAMSVTLAAQPTHDDHSGS